MTYDEYQQAAIDALDGYHLILAPPGCGKTDILTRRIERAHEQGVAYSDMACLTFTNRASKGMQERVVRNTHEPVPSDLFIGNVHRLCATFLFENSLIPQNTAIIDEFDYDSIVHDLAEQLCGKEWSDTMSPTRIVNLQHALKQLSQGVDPSVMLHAEELDQIRNTLEFLIAETGEDESYVYCHIEELWERITEIPISMGARLIRLALRYEQYKAENDMLDYDDLIVRTYEECSHNNEYHKYRWIQVDEVQDLSPAQLAIVDLFTSDDNPTVVYLGDEQQAIFSFIGAKMETLEMLRQRCDGNIHRLYRNYRSPKYLLDVVNAYAVQQLNIDPLLLPSTDNTEESNNKTLYALQCDSISEEYAMAVRQAIGYSKEEDSGRIAIIVPYNTHADKVSEALLEENIPHFKISGTDLFSTPTVQTIFSHLAIAQNEGGFTSWAKLLYHSGIISRYTEARNFMRTMRKNGMIPTDFIRYEGSSYLQQMSFAYDHREIVIFDTETTGLDIYNDEIIQIAAVKVRGNKIVEESNFNIFLEINKEIPPVLKGDKANPMVEQYAQHPHLSRREGLMQFLDYCKGCVLVGHNVEYDYHILDYNLRRDCPEMDLCTLFPEYYDTLKYIRLVEPRQRHYSLEKLLVALNLEGANSHMADDDIMATKSLLDYCRLHAEPQLERQRQFFEDRKMSSIVRKIRENYGPHYLHTFGRLYETEPEGERVVREPLLVQELEHTYHEMAKAGMVKEIDKWHHIINYLTEDVINPIRYNSLKGQLEHYNGDLLTCREADLCGSHSVKEQFFVSTVHKAKGLEFESVIIFEANQDKYPHKKSETPEAMQEDARKFYVALSRAKRRLCIMCTQNPSPFLHCIADQFYWYAKPEGKFKLTNAPQAPELRSAQAAYRNGANLRKLGKSQEAITYFEKALELQPSHQYALMQLADIHLSLGNKAEMERLLAGKTHEDGNHMPLLDTGERNVIISEPNSHQQGQTVMYHPNPYFEQRDSYPIVINPKIGDKVLLPRKGASTVKQFKTISFARAIEQTVVGVFVSADCHVAVPGSQRPYEPAIMLCNQSINLFIDVEIDAPYDGVYRHVTHEKDNRYDAMRDAYFTSNGWIVVRFSERQVQFQEYECLMYLADIVNSAYNRLAPRVSNLAKEPRWDNFQAMRWQREMLREHYLGIAAFEPYNFSTRIKVADEPEPEELLFDEETHSYAPAHNRSGSADYISVTTLISRFFPFDTEGWLQRKAATENRPIEDLRSELEALQADASNRGTELHADIEHFLKGETIVNDSKEYGFFMNFYHDKLEPGLEFVDAEKMIFMPEYRVAGTVDALFRRKRDGAYIMVDWKRSTHLILDEGHIHKYGHGRGLSILSHLDSSSYYQYEMQQSFYKYILEKRYGIHVEHMMLCVLHPEYSRYYPIRLENYREREVKAILDSINLYQ